MKISKNKKSITVKDYIKANRKGSRDAALEGKTGFVAKSKIHKGEKNYIRVKKNWLDDVE
jgi:hypothetical protein